MPIQNHQVDSGKKKLFRHKIMQIIQGKRKKAKGMEEMGLYEEGWNKGKDDKGRMKGKGRKKWGILKCEYTRDGCGGGGGGG